MYINIGMIKINIITNIASLNVGKTILCRNNSSTTNYPEAPTSESVQIEGQLNPVGSFPSPVPAASIPQTLPFKSPKIPKVPKLPHIPSFSAAMPSFPPIQAPSSGAPAGGSGFNAFVPIHPAARDRQ
jgi:hypothetical protein